MDAEGGSQVFNIAGRVLVLFTNNYKDKLFLQTKSELSCEHLCLFPLQVR